MVEIAPSTGGLALWVRHCELPADVDSLPVVTDGNAILYGIAFEDLSLPEQAGLVAHEVLHIALRHPQRYLDLQHLLGDVDLTLFNICADAIVNSTLGHLDWLQLPASAVYLDRLLDRALGINEDVAKSLLEWDVERLYREIDDRQLPATGGRRSERGQSGSRADARGGGASKSAAASPADSQFKAGARFDGPRAAAARALGDRHCAYILPGPDTQGVPEAEAEQARAWSERLLRGHAGDGEHSMLRALIADLPKIRTPWEQILRTRLAHSLTPKPDVSWSRPSRSYLASQGRGGPHRRRPWEPGFSTARRVPRLAVIVDVSGSIADELLWRFATEIEAITRRLESSLVLIIGDDQVRRVEHFEPGCSDLRAIEFSGGGGTDFALLLEEADSHRPDIAVVLTDLEGPARFRPRWPVIWAVPEGCDRAVEPFGRKLVLN